MKPAKAEYYNPKLKGKQDGQDMDDLPTITPRSNLNVSPSHVPPPTGPVNPLKRASRTPPSRAENQELSPSPRDSGSPYEKPQSPVYEQTGEQASLQAREHDSLLADIRKIVKAQGKEVSYVRLTREEKDQLADIIYSYKRQGVKTSETEISRIAINYLIEEYKLNGQASVLARLLVLLNA